MKFNTKVEMKYLIASVILLICIVVIYNGNNEDKYVLLILFAALFIFLTIMFIIGVNHSIQVMDDRSIIIRKFIKNYQFDINELLRIEVYHSIRTGRYLSINLIVFTLKDRSIINYPYAGKPNQELVRYLKTIVGKDKIKFKKEHKKYKKREYLISFISCIIFTLFSLFLLIYNINDFSIKIFLLIGFIILGIIGACFYYKKYKLYRDK